MVLAVALPLLEAQPALSFPNAINFWHNAEKGGLSAPTLYGRRHGGGNDRGGRELPSRLSTPIGKFGHGCSFLL